LSSNEHDSPKGGESFFSKNLIFIPSKSNPTAMSTEEDTYNIIFKAMQHPIRRRILRTLSETPSTYTEIQRTLNIDNGLLNYHLDNMKDLITKNMDEKYTLSEFGKATVNLVRGVEEPAKLAQTPYAASSRLTFKLLVIVFAAVVIVSSAVIFDFNNKYVDLSGRFNSQSVELAQLQNTNAMLRETLRKINATLISTQKSDLVKVPFQQLLLEEARRTNGTKVTLLILDTDVVNGVEIPTAARLVSKDEVSSMAMGTNGTRVYVVDSISYSIPTRGLVKVSGYYVSSVGGVPVTYSVEETTYFLEKKDGEWRIYTTMVAFGDYFRAIPFFEVIQ
jgi:DNA-binding transcriptional ArsR family regulator